VIVDAELHFVDVPIHIARQDSKTCRAIEISGIPVFVFAAEIQVIIFNLGRPVFQECPFDATTYRPAEAGHVAGHFGEQQVAEGRIDSFNACGRARGGSCD